MYTMRLFIFFSIMLVSCVDSETKSSGKTFKDSDFQTITISPVRHYSIDDPGLIKGVIFHNERILLNIQNQDSVIKQLKILPDGSLRKSYLLKRDTSENSVLSVSKFGVQNNSSVFLFDLAKASCFALKNDKKNGYELSFRMKFTDSNRLCSNPLFLNDSIVVSTSYKSSPKRLTFININNPREIGVAGDYILASGFEGETTMQAIAQSYQCVIAYDSISKQIALANRYTDKIEFYNRDGQKKFYLSGPLQEEAKYKVVHDRAGSHFSQQSDKRFMYLGAQFAFNKLFTLFSGQTFYDQYKKKDVVDSKFNKIASGTCLYIFSADGIPYLKLNLSIDFPTSFYVDVHSSVMYVVDRDNKIHLFDLKNIWNEKVDK